jgi:tol-pal system protein YbgF
VEAEHRAAEAWRQAEIQAAEGRRVEAERQAAEAKRQAESQAAEARRVEAERQAGEAKRRQAELAVAPLDGVYFTVRSAPLLDRPNGTKLGSLPAEQRVVVTGQTTAGDWLRVTIGGSPHWVAAGDLVEQRVAEQRAWSRLGKDPTEASLIAFLKRFPDGAFADAAKQRIGGKRGEEATRVAQEDMSRALADEEAGQAKPKVAAPVSGNSASAPSAALDLLRLRTPAAEPASESPRAVPSGAGGTAAASQAMLDAGALRTDFPRGSSAELYDQAIGMIRKGNSSAAEPLLQRIIAEHPNDPLAANAKYRLAEAYFRQADYARSAIAFYDFRRSYPQHVNAPGALIGYASALGNLGRKGEACLALRQVSQEFPGASTDVKEQQNAEMRRFGC